MAKPNILLRSKLKRAQQALEQGQWAEGKRLYQQLAPKLATDPDLWTNLGYLHSKLGEASDALRCFEKAANVGPQRAEAHLNLGKSYADLGELEKAAQAYGEAVRLKPDWTMALFDYAHTLHRLGRLPEAIDHYRRTLALDSNDIDAMVNLAGALSAIQQQVEASNCIQSVLDRVPTHPQALLLAANIERQRGALDKALHYAQILRTNHPRQPSAVVAEAQILERQGNWQAAYTLIAPWLTGQTIHPPIAILFAKLCQQMDRCDDATSLLEKSIAQPMVSRQSHVDLHYAAGELYDTLGRYEQAIQHIDQANKMALAGFDSDAHQHFVDQIIERFDRNFFRQMATADKRSKPPLFIIGMPRSGTTLVEQILASHADIVAAGELPFIDEIGRQTSQQLSGQPFPAGLTQLTPDRLDKMARRYLEQTAPFIADHRYVSDKMPQNFFYLGLIALLFPNAKIIHCQRNPLDTCLSCYFQNFNIGQGYSNDLTSLAHYYNDYQRLMQHWDDALPLEILHISYEALIHEPQSNIQRMTDYLDLPWDDQCLTFYNNPRHVATASYQQVIQPLYSHSIGRWKHYQHHLQPLIDALHNAKGNDPG